MTRRNLRQLVFVALAALLVAGLVVPPAQALPTSSKTAADQSLAERAEDMAVLEAALDHAEVEDALAAQGLSRDEVNQRLAQLSPEEIQSLSTQVDQIQAAGQPQSSYFWVLIAVLIVVAIVALA